MCTQFSENSDKNKITVELYKAINIIRASVGVWRSLVAHFAGGEGVVGSNPITPTNYEVPNKTSCVQPYPLAAT